MYDNNHKPPGLMISLDFLTPSKRGKGKSKKYGENDEEMEEDNEKNMSYADLAKKRLAKKKRK